MQLEGFINTHFRGLIAPHFIAGWRARGIARLLPFQERVARALAAEASHHAGRRMGRNALITAPTSAGKTLLAEIEIARHLTAGLRAAYLVPTRALAEQKAAEFARWLEPAGLRIACATRDRPETDPLVASGGFDLLVAVHEKMNHYLMAHPSVVNSLGVVVVDEIQMLGDRERGGTLDLLLTKLRLPPRAIRLLAISAVVNRVTASRLASWLDAELYEDTARPLDLREGVLDAATGLFTYRDSASGEEATEWLAAPEELERLTRTVSDAAAEATGPADAASAGLVASAALLARRGEPVLLFAPTRRCSRNWAAWLAGLEGGFEPARLALPRLRALEPGRTRDLLERCLARGVAFHNADLDEPARRIVEDAFNAGEVRVVAATPTLSMGVNLSARNVLHCPWRIAGGAGRLARLPLGRARFSNQGGRAARFGIGADFGRSILVAQSQAEAQRFWAVFVTPDPESLDPPLAAPDVPAMALDLLAAGLGGSAEKLAATMAETFSARSLRADSPAHAAWLDPEEVRARLGLLARAELIRPVPALGGLRPGETSWTLTGLGELTASLGLSPAAAMELRDWVAGYGARLAAADAVLDPDAATEAFFELAVTEEGRRARSGLAAAAWGSTLPGASVHDGVDPVSASALRRITSSGSRAGGLSRDESAAFRAAMLLSDWIGGVENEAIELRHRVFCGSLARAAEEFEWLVRAAASLAPAAGLSALGAARLFDLAARIRWGVPAGLLPLAQLRIPGLGRSGLARLAGAGFNQPALLAAASRSALAEIVGLDLAHTIESELARRPGPAALIDTPADSTLSASTLPEFVLANEPAAPPVPAVADSLLLEINLQSPGVIRAGGREITLPPTSFDLLALLAERPGEVVTREAIYQRLWPDGGPEPQQIDGHRRTLIRRLKPALRGESSRIAEVIRGIGLRMAVPAGHVSLRR